MKSTVATRGRRLKIRLCVLAAAAVALLLLALSAAKYISIPDWSKVVLVTCVAVGILLSIADLLEDSIPRRKALGAILTFIVALYVLPLISVSFAESILGKSNVPGAKVVLYLLTYSINIIYCLLHRDVVESRISEFKAALYISAGLYALVLAIFALVSPSKMQDISTTRVAAIFVSFTMCRGLVEVFGIRDNE